MTRVRDTIVALSSPPVTAGSSTLTKRDLARAIVRLSGAKAVQYAAQVFKPATGDLAVSGWRRIAGEVRWKNHTLAAHAYVMRSPKSYTREDIVELHVPALPWLLSALLGELLSAGARLAQPGEFTRRAFENGRMNLDQAQAVGELIASRSADEARAFAARLRAHPQRERHSLRDEIEELLSLVELGLDFSHEDVGVLTVEQMLVKLRSLHARAVEFLREHGGDDATFASAVLNAGLPRVLLLGPTNAGKSSLFNRLLERDAAIVSPRRHTTRDAVEAPLHFSGDMSAVLVDSAGSGVELALRGPALPEEALLQAGWHATLSAARSADLILLALDRSAPLAEQDSLQLFAEALAQARPAARAVLWTKSDLAPAENWSTDASLFHNGEEIVVTHRFAISALSGDGVKTLREFLRGQVAELQSRPQDAALAAASTARAAARSAAEALKRAEEGLAAGHGEDVVAVELREAVHAFWQAEGVLLRHDAVTEAALDKIFARFCIGK